MSIVSRKLYTIQLRSAKLELGKHTLVMGILNVTPDSFSDGGKLYNSDIALTHASLMIEEGADILDIGGESTRPDSYPVPLDVELDRVIPLIVSIRKFSDIPISIDTTKSEVALQALDAGADIINDVSSLRFDSQMVDIAASSGAALILMHMQGIPKNMQLNPHYDSIFTEITAFIEDRILFATQRGVERSQIIVDPGIGFGKTATHNSLIIGNLEFLQSLDRPILLGASRKRFIGAILDRPVEDREVGTAAANSFGIAAGAHIIRVHDVAFHKQAALMSDALRNARQDNDFPVKY
ncbi:MAG: dihydropteroate synthase [Syntrophobacteraceae bacterium]